MPPRSPRTQVTKQATHNRSTALAQQVFTAPGLMTDDMLRAEIAALLAHEASLARRWQCPRPDCDGLPHPGWTHNHARGKQHMPDGDWWLWLLLTGRGFGKTRTSAETVRKWVEKPGTSVAVVARKSTLVRTVCFEAPKAGLLAVLDPDDVARYIRSSDDLRIEMKNGSVIRGFSAEVPDNLNGNAFDKSWCDEYAVWGKTTAQATWDTLRFCMREAPDPQTLVSTTPRGNAHLKKLLALVQKSLGETEEGEEQEEVPTIGRRAVLTTGSMHENKANLNQDFRQEIEQGYGGTRMGAQEIEGLLLDDVEGALWSPSTFDYSGDLEFRLTEAQLPDMDRVVVAVDPATTSAETSDRTGIVVGGRSSLPSVSWRDKQPHAFLLHAEEARRTPNAAMRRAVDLYRIHRADCIVVEANNGGDYLPALIHTIDPNVPVRVVNATRGKRARAAPIAQLYERQKVHHVGPAVKFKALEEQQTTYVGIGKEDKESPDLLDAAVWCLTDLLIDKTGPANLQVNDMRSARR